MNGSRIAALISGALALAACARSPQADVAAGDVAVRDVQAVRWTADLTPPAGGGVARADTGPRRDTAAMTSGQVSGSATVTAGDAPGTAKVTITIANATAGSSHPWHLHVGTCSDDRGVVGNATDYPALTVGQDGRATATANVSAAAPTSGEYMVNVHQSSAEMGKIIACGNLTKQ